MDYICTFNNDDESANTYNGVDLEENDNTLKTLFLDLSIEPHNRKFKLFDERKAFLICINCILHMHSNVPSKIFYISIDSETLRIAWT